ncbi:hypothetical protein DWY99_01085 [[Clostridium] leptum]|uniref:Uncharacterized protein n=1 Tax=[Clostridium] leptum TaxID=1535 RepID=A0A412B0U3_9FIRM|nr:hypothetical protein DWY99_01085 [[Clostridium] leptum]
MVSAERAAGAAEETSGKTGEERRRMKVPRYKSRFAEERQKHSRKGRYALSCNRNHRRRPAGRLSLQMPGGADCLQISCRIGKLPLARRFAGLRLPGLGAAEQTVRAEQEVRRLSKCLAVQALKGRNQKFVSAGGCE